MNKRQLNHIFFVIIGPSGSGKTEISSSVFPNNYKVVSHTTRPKRLNEIDGQDYHFETQHTFSKLIAMNVLAEHDFFNGYQYGVAISDIIKITENHVAYDVLTFNGFVAIEKLFGEKVVPIYFDVSKENVFLRLKKRETDSVKIAERLALYDEEIVVREKLKAYSNLIIINANRPFEYVVKNFEKVLKKSKRQL